MDRNDVLKEFNRIFIDVLEDDDIVIKFETTAMDVAEWDSLNHLQLVIAIEKFFEVRFTASEIQNFQNVGEMIDALILKK